MLQPSLFTITVTPGQYRCKKTKHLESLAVSSWGIEKRQQDIRDEPPIDVIVRRILAQTSESFHEVLIHDNT